MHDRVTICGGVLGGHPRLVADEILALSVANCRSTWRWRDGSSARMGPHEKARCKKPKGPTGRVRDSDLIDGSLMSHVSEAHHIAVQAGTCHKR